MSDEGARAAYQRRESTSTYLCHLCSNFGIQTREFNLHLMHRLFRGYLLRWRDKGGVSLRA